MQLFPRECEVLQDTDFLFHFYWFSNLLTGTKRWSTSCLLKSCRINVTPKMTPVILSQGRTCESISKFYLQSVRPKSISSFSAIYPNLVTMIKMSTSSVFSLYALSARHTCDFIGVPCWQYGCILPYVNYMHVIICCYTVTCPVARLLNLILHYAHKFCCLQIVQKIRGIVW